jgi:hypothetical protein
MTILAPMLPEFHAAQKSTATPSRRNPADCGETPDRRSRDEADARQEDFDDDGSLRPDRPRLTTSGARAALGVCRRKRCQTVMDLGLDSPDPGPIDWWS